MGVGRWLGAGVVAAVLAVVPSQGWQLPDAWKPWTPLRFEDAQGITRTAAQVTPFVLSCRAALSLALWERHVVRPLASEHFGGAVRRLENAGSYACRNIGGGDRRSQHARADALDVTGFV